MKRTLSLFLMLVLLLLAGCNDPKPLTDALHRVEALMNEYPDSAWAVLNALSPDEMPCPLCPALHPGAGQDLS